MSMDKYGVIPENEFPKDGCYCKRCEVARQRDACGKTSEDRYIDGCGCTECEQVRTNRGELSIFSRGKVQPVPLIDADNSYGYPMLGCDCSKCEKARLRDMEVPTVQVVQTGKIVTQQKFHPLSQTKLFFFQSSAVCAGDGLQEDNGYVIGVALSGYDPDGFLLVKLLTEGDTIKYDASSKYKDDSVRR